jgi:hypothetical protein
VRNIVETWANQDLNKTAAWLEKLGVGQARDAGVHEFTRRVTDTDPAGAAAWAVTIADPETRDGSIERIYRRWVRRDQQSAYDFIATTPGASDQLRRKLMGAQ